LAEIGENIKPQPGTTLDDILEVFYFFYSNFISFVDINYQLDLGDKLETVLKICDVAAKEYGFF
jgi:hypothetical protein